MMSKRVRHIAGLVICALGGSLASQFLFWGFVDRNGIKIAVGVGILVGLCCWFGWALWTTREVTGEVYDTPDAPEWTWAPPTRALHITDWDSPASKADTP